MKMVTLISAALVAVLVTQPAQAQLATFDASNFAQALHTARNTLAQIEQAKRIYEAANQITDISSVASLLNNPELRGALPKEITLIGDDFAQMAQVGKRAEALFQQGNYQSGGSASQVVSALVKLGRRAARDRAIAEQAMDFGRARADGLTALNRRLASAATSKEATDLSARASIEVAAGVNETNRLIALQIQQQAEREQLAAEASAQRVRDNKEQGDRARVALFGSTGE